jgi:erythrocyte band 7 integral membrane protein
MLLVSISKNYSTVPRALGNDTIFELILTLVYSLLLFLLLRGVKVERCELKDVSLPVQLQRVMASEAEATREARAKVVTAHGEYKASISLKKAADVISLNPVALQLRYLQTLLHIADENNSTIIFPIPIELLKTFANR